MFIKRYLTLRVNVNNNACTKFKPKIKSTSIAILFLLKQKQNGE